MITRSILFALLFLTSQLATFAVENQFIRTPGHYPLDTQGSALTIKIQPDGTWTLAFTNATGSMLPENCLRAKGWFVFVEKPNRIWIFNGVDGGLLMEHTEKSMTNSAIYSGNLTNCPKTFLDALPPQARAKIQGDKPAKKE